MERETMSKYLVIIYVIITFTPFHLYAQNIEIKCDFNDNNVDTDKLYSTGTYDKNISGTLCYGNITDDEMFGKLHFKYYFPLKNGKLNGREQSFIKYENDDNFHINSYSEYKDGIKNGKEVFYYDDGSIINESNYKNGQLDGVLKEYSEDGMLTLEAEYKNGKEHGKVIYYNEDGIEKIEYFNNGVKVK